MAKSELCIYSVRFEPRPLVGVRFANPGIVEEFEGAIKDRWNNFQAYMDSFAGPPSDVYSAENDMNSGIGITPWQYAEKGVIAAGSGSHLRARQYILAGCYNATLVVGGGGNGFDYDLEMLFAVDDHESFVGDVRKIMETGLPSSITVRQPRRLYVNKDERGLHVGFGNGLAKAPYSLKS